MFIDKKAYIISFGAILSGMAIILQSAPVFLGGVGLLLSPLSTLPVAIGTAIKTKLGFMVYISSALALFMIYPEEALIFLFATGVLGITLGMTAIVYHSLKAIIMSSVALFLGMVIMTYGIGIAAFGEFTSSLSTEIVVLIFFAFLYTSI